MFVGSSLLLSLTRHTAALGGLRPHRGPFGLSRVRWCAQQYPDLHLYPPCPPGTVGAVAWPAGGPAWSWLESTYTSGLGQSKTLVDRAPSPGCLGAPGYQQAWLLGRRGTKNKLQKASLLGPPLSCYDNRAQGPHHAALTLGRAAGLKGVWEGDPRFHHSPAAEPPPTAFFLPSDCFPVRRPLLHTHESFGTKPPHPQLSTRVPCKRNTEKQKKCHRDPRSLRHLSLGVGIAWEPCAHAWGSRGKDD